MKSVSSCSPLGPAASVLRTMARKESTTTIPGSDLSTSSTMAVQHLRHPSVERLLPEVDEANRCRRPPWQRRRKRTVADSAAS